MVKIIGAVMTGLACGYFGFRFSATLKMRAKTLADIVTSLEMLESEIFFSRNKLKKAFLHVDRCGIFSDAANEMEENGIKRAWKHAVEKNQTRLCLTNSDAEILYTFGKNIGKTDTDDQIKNIKYIKTMIKEQEKQASGEYSRFGKLYRSGGVLVGLMIVIILI